MVSDRQDLWKTPSRALHRLNLQPYHRRLKSKHTKRNKLLGSVSGDVWYLQAKRIRSRPKLGRKSWKDLNRSIISMFKNPGWFVTLGFTLPIVCLIIPFTLKIHYPSCLFIHSIPGILVDVKEKFGVFVGILLFLLILKFIFFHQKQNFKLNKITTHSSALKRCRTRRIKKPLTCYSLRLFLFKLSILRSRHPWSAFLSIICI